MNTPQPKKKPRPATPAKAKTRSAPEPAADVDQQTVDYSDPANQAAKEWLEACGQEPTPQRVLALAPFTQVELSGRRRRFANMCISQGELPTKGNIKARITAERKGLEAKGTLEEVYEKHPNIDDIIVDYVRQERAKNGVGPAWGPIMKRLDVPRHLRTPLMVQLAKKGRVTFTREPGSIDVVEPPSGQDA